MYYKLFLSSVLAAVLMLGGCAAVQNKPQQPDPAQTVAEAIGNSGIEELSTMQGSRTKNTTVFQQYGGQVTRTTALIKQPFCPPENQALEGKEPGECVVFDKATVHRTSAHPGDLNASMVRNVDGSEQIVFGTATVSDGETARALSEDATTQQTDTQTTTKAGLEKGSDLQGSVDNPEIEKLRQETEQLKLRLDALNNTVDKGSEALKPLNLNQ